MNETVPRPARALGSIRHSAVGPKKQPLINRSSKRVQSAFEANKGKTLTLNMEVIAVSRTSKPLNAKAASGPASGSSPSNSISMKYGGGELPLGHGRRHSASTKAMNPLGIEPLTGLQFRVTSGKTASHEDSLQTARIWNEGGSVKSEKKKMVSDHGHLESSRTFVKLNHQMHTHRQQKRSYLEDGDFVKGRGHKIDTGPLSRPVSGWLNRESRNAVELAEKDEGQSELGRYYSLDVDTGAVTARHLCSEESTIIGVNGKERKQANGGDGEAEELVADAEECETPREESERYPSCLVPLSWNDQFMKPRVKVVKPRLPSAQATFSSVSETRPVMFRTSLQRDVIPPSFTKIQTPSKENFVSTTIHKKTGQSATNKKQQTVRFDEFFQHSVKSGESIVGDGGESLDSSSFRYKSSENQRTRSSSCFSTAGSEKLGSVVEPPSLTRSHGRQGDARGEMIVVGNAQISSKMAENETPASRGGAGLVEKPLAVNHRNGVRIGREPGIPASKEVAIINIVQPIRTKQGTEENGDATDATKTSETNEWKNGSSIRLKYSVRKPRASTGIKRGHPEGLFKGPVMVRSASVREGRLATLSRENSSNDWNLNAVNEQPVQLGEGPNRPEVSKTGEWSSEEARTSGKQGGKERLANRNSSLSQPFDVVQLSPTRMRTAPVQNRSMHLREDPYTELRNVTMESSENSSTPPPSRIATPNVRSSSAWSFSILEEDSSSGGNSRRDAVVHHIPVAVNSRMSECEDQQRIPETVTVEEEPYQHEELEGENAWKTPDAVEQRPAGEPELETEQGET